MVQLVAGPSVVASSACNHGLERIAQSPQTMEPATAESTCTCDTESSC